MPVSSRPPKRIAQVRQAVRLRQYSRRTEEAYAGWIKRYIRYHGLRHPAELGVADVERFLADLAQHRSLGESSLDERGRDLQSTTG